MPRLAKGERIPLEVRLSKFKLVSQLDFWEGTPCWYWTGHHQLSNSGLYPTMNVEGKPIKLSRLMASKHLGLDLNDATQQALHHCDRPGCWNPEHLFVGTAKDNTLDSVKKGRHRPKGLKYRRK